MAIKRGVSLYSYQQAYLKGQLDLEGCIKTMVETTGAKGVELIYEQMPVEKYPGRVYPNISKEGVARWKDLMEKYGTTPTCMDSFVDSKVYKGRISSFQEQVQMMEQDLELAGKLGFSCIRVLASVPPEVIEASIPAAEYYGVAMGQEVHPRLDVTDQWVQNVVEMARKHNTRYCGIIPDFGIFTRGMFGSQLHFLEVMGESKDITDYIRENYRKEADLPETLEAVQSMGAMDRTISMLKGSTFMGHYCEPSTLAEVMDVVVHFHGKFYRMTEDCQEPTINYAEAIKVIKDSGWDGYISSEFEGQRIYHEQGCPYEEDEIEQVRRHHVMLKQLIGE